MVWGRSFLYLWVIIVESFCLLTRIHGCTCGCASLEVSVAYHGGTQGTNNILWVALMIPGNLFTIFPCQHSQKKCFSKTFIKCVNLDLAVLRGELKGLPYPKEKNLLKSKTALCLEIHISKDIQ